MKKGAVIGTSIVAAAAGILIYQKFLSEPQVKIVKLDKEEEIVTFKFGNISTVIEYADMVRPLLIKGRQDFTLKVVKKDKVIEFQKLRHGKLVEYPVVIEI